MLHVATVHYRSPRWIDIQRRELERHIGVPFEVWSSIELIDASYADRFEHVVEQLGDHQGKLNHLALEIAQRAADDDLLMFIDGDAFPLADPMPAISEALERAPLLAVRRDENAHDPQPHPCFCVTTVGAWRALAGDWSPGYAWPADRGRLVSDVGGNLLRKLELTATPWVPLLRSNGRALDPLFFGVYGGIVYHHGAGFRAGQLSRAHLDGAPPALAASSPLAAAAIRRLNRRRRHAFERSVQRRYVADSERIYELIAADDPRWPAEVGAGPGRAAPSAA